MGAALVLLLVGLGAMAAGVLIGRYYVPDDRQLRRTARHSRAYMRALSHLVARDHDTVVTELRAVVEENVDEVEPYFALGAIFRSRGEHERAIRVHQALALRERDKRKLRQRAMYELGLDFRAAGMPRRATRAMEEVLLEDPSHEGALRVLAALYEEQARFNEAAGLWQRLGRRRGEDHSHREHHLLVAAAQAALGRDDLDSAKQLLKAAQKHEESPHFYAAAAELAAARGNHRSAKERLKQALVADPGLAPHLLPGLIAAEQGLAGPVDQARHGDDELGDDEGADAAQLAAAPAPQLKAGSAAQLVAGSPVASEAASEAAPALPGSTETALAPPASVTEPGSAVDQTALVPAPSASSPVLAGEVASRAAPGPGEGKEAAPASSPREANEAASPSVRGEGKAIPSPSGRGASSIVAVTSEPNEPRSPGVAGREGKATPSPWGRGAPSIAATKGVGAGVDRAAGLPGESAVLAEDQPPPPWLAEQVLAMLAEVEAQTGPRLELALIRAQLVPPADAAGRAVLASELTAQFPGSLAARVATARLALASDDRAAMRGALDGLVAETGALAWALRGRWQCAHCGNRPGPFSWRCGQCRRWNTLRMETGVEPPPVPPRERRAAPRVARPDALLGASPDESLPAPTIDPGLSASELASAGARRSLLGRVGGWVSGVWRRDAS
jgi:lipopolysaccharide biosynthesis regulator YciM